MGCDLDCWIVIWVLVVVDLRFWVVAVVIDWLWCRHGCRGSSVLLLEGLVLGFVAMVEFGFGFWWFLWLSLIGVSCGCYWLLLGFGCYCYHGVGLLV